MGAPALLEDAEPGLLLVGQPYVDVGLRFSYDFDLLVSVVLVEAGVALGAVVDVLNDDVVSRFFNIGLQ